MKSRSILNSMNIVHLRKLLALTKSIVQTSQIKEVAKGK